MKNESWAKYDKLSYASNESENILFTVVPSAIAII